MATDALSCQMPADPPASARSASQVVPASPSDPSALYLLDWEDPATRTLPAQPPAGWDAEPNPPVRTDGSPMISIGTHDAGDPVRNGGYAARFDLRHDDAATNHGTRAELAVWPPEPRGAERWYGLSTYLQNWAPDRAPESIFQWHQGGLVPCPQGCSPPLAIVNQLNATTGAYEQHVHQAWRPDPVDPLISQDVADHRVSLVVDHAVRCPGQDLCNRPLPGHGCDAVVPSAARDSTTASHRSRVDPPTRP